MRVQVTDAPETRSAAGPHANVPNLSSLTITGPLSVAWPVFVTL